MPLAWKKIQKPQTPFNKHYAEDLYEFIHNASPAAVFEPSIYCDIRQEEDIRKIVLDLETTDAEQFLAVEKWIALFVTMILSIISPGDGPTILFASAFQFVLGPDDLEPLNLHDFLEALDFKEDEDFFFLDMSEKWIYFESFAGRSLGILSSNHLSKLGGKKLGATPLFLAELTQSPPIDPLSKRPRGSGSRGIEKSPELDQGAPGQVQYPVLPSVSEEKKRGGVRGRGAVPTSASDRKDIQAAETEGRALLDTIQEGISKMLRDLKDVEKKIQEARTQGLDLGALGLISKAMVQTFSKSIKISKDMMDQGSSPANILDELDKTSATNTKLGENPGFIVCLHVGKVSSLEINNRKTYWALMKLAIEKNLKIAEEAGYSDELGAGISYYLALGLVPEDWYGNIAQFNVLQAVYDHAHRNSLLESSLTGDVSAHAKEGICLARDALVCCALSFSRCGRSSKISKRASGTALKGIHSPSKIYASNPETSYMDTSEYSPTTISHGPENQSFRAIVFEVANVFLTSGNHLAPAMVLMMSLASGSGFSRSLSARLDGLKANYKVCLQYLSTQRNVGRYLKSLKNEIMAVLEVASKLKANPFFFSRCYPDGRVNDDSLDSKNIANLTAVAMSFLRDQGHSSLKNLRISTTIAPFAYRGLKIAAAEQKKKPIDEAKRMMECILDEELTDAAFSKIKEAGGFNNFLLSLRNEPSIMNTLNLDLQVVEYAGDFVKNLTTAAAASEAVDVETTLAVVLKRMDDAFKATQQIKSLLSSEAAQASLTRTSEFMSGIYSDSQPDETPTQQSSIRNPVLEALEM